MKPTPSHDDTITPLGVDLSSQTRTTAVSPLALATFLFLASVTAVIGWLVVAGDPKGGEPEVVVALAWEGRMQQEIDPEVLIDAYAGTLAAAPKPRRKPISVAELRRTDTTPTQSAAAPAQRAAPARSSSLALAPAPDPALISRSRDGMLPVIAPDGRRAMSVYARPSNADTSRPRVAILIRGLGLSESATQTAIDTLPPEVTLSFVPYPKNLQTWVNKARAAGHEVMLELPMEPYDYPDNDPGPSTLLTGLELDENQKRLEWLLSRFSGYVGVTNYLGAKFVSTRRSFEPVLNDIVKRGLLYLDDGSADGQVLSEIADATGLSWTKSTASLDYASASAIDVDLVNLEGLSRQRGVAVATGFSFPVTMKRISDWADDLENKGIQLVPISAVVGMPPQS